ncbi:hypothetical protein QL285_052386 [Trifolium repens]|jgi:hypothetical protein|nr:hypothetical protein QL285_052386 [Trifolium repens]
MVVAAEGAVCLRMTMVANPSESMANLNQIDGVDELEFVGSNEKSFLGGQKESNVEIFVKYVVRFLGAQYMLQLGRAQYMLEFGVAQYVVRSTVG